MKFISHENKLDYSLILTLTQIHDAHKMSISGRFRGGSGGSLEHPSGAKLSQFHGERPREFKA